MANQTITAADGILSKLADMFFKGLDKVMDSAIEYQNENGILTGTSTIKVVNDKGKEFLFEVKLSPVQGGGNNREGLFMVNFKCPGKKIKTDINGEDYEGKVLRINKDTKSEFENVINSMLTRNKLVRIDDAESGQSDSAKTDKEKLDLSEEEEGIQPIREIDAYDTTIGEEESPKYHVTVVVEPLKTSPHKCHIQISSEPLVGNMVDKEVKLDDIRKTVATYFEDNQLEAYSTTDNKWVNDWEKDQKSGKQNAAASKRINLVLKKKITATSTVVDVQKVYASYDLAEAMSSVDTLLNNDDFINSLNEGETSFIVIDEGEDLDVNETAEPFNMIEVAEAIYSASMSFFITSKLLSLTLDSCSELTYEASDIANIMGRYIVAEGHKLPDNNISLPHIPITPQSTRKEQLEFRLETITAYSALVESYFYNFDRNIQRQLECSLNCIYNEIENLKIWIQQGDAEQSAQCQQELVMQPREAVMTQF